MIRWVFLAAGVLYLLFLTVFWSLLRVASAADDGVFDIEPDPPGRPCPLCTSSNVYTDLDGICFCITCRASYHSTSVTELS